MRALLFNLTGALASNLVSGVHDATTVVYLVGMMGVTAVSWALRPPSRRNFAVIGVRDHAQRC
jgi:hypothetical protein